MKSNLFSLDYRDVGKGLVVAVLVALLGAIQQALQGNGLDVAAYDWMAIADITWKAASAYLIKNLFSDSEGKVLGRIG